MENLRPGSIFINYRRDDSLDEAKHFKAIFDQHFQEDTTFLDEKAIKLTDRWKEIIKESMQKAETLLALIGPDWIKGFTKKAQQAQTDWVRFELKTAREEGIDIIPVYLNMDRALDETDLPEEFPEDIKFLTHQQGIYVPKGQFSEKAADLANCLKVLFGHKNNAEVTTSMHIPLLNALPLPNDYIKQARKLDCPYLGPRYFEEREAALYFGRERDIRRLFHMTRQNQIILLYGYSGIGKSSLLHAGFVPRVKDLAGWKVHDPIRRNKQEGGLSFQLKQVFKDLPKENSATKQVFILDQVEEMITDPLPPSKKEGESLMKTINEKVIQDPALRFILVFRSDYLASIEDILVDNDAEDFEKLHLRPLSKEGMEEAIKGVAENRKLNVRFCLKFESRLPETIAQDLQGDDPFAVRTPLLQIQLLKLFKAAKEIRRDPNVDPILFTEELYQANRQHNLDEFLQEQLEIISQPDWKDYLEKGLFLDILIHYVTSDNTAGSFKDEEILKKYPHVEPIASIIQAFKRNYLLVNEPGKKPSSRLAHDALAPAIKRAVDNSSAPAQDARRMLESKRGDIESGRASFKDRDDIQKLEQGRPYMRIWTKEEEWAYKKGKQYLESQLEREKAILAKEEAARKRVFLFLKERIELTILQLDYDETFQRTIELAELGYQPEEVARFFHELAFFWSAAGEKGKAVNTLMEARSLNIFNNLQEDIEWLVADPQLSNFQEVLVRMDKEGYDKLNKRYYPDMILVEGGTFNMGSEEENREKSIHPVKLNSFKIAQTPTTFWQFGLFCAATKRKVHHHSPSLGIFGDNPVVNVSWYDAVEYANWFSAHLNLSAAYIIDKDRKDSNNENKYDEIKWFVESNWDANGFRLPTESEWEYAAMGGQKTKGYRFAGSDNLNEVGWYSENSDINGVRRTHPVKGKKPNELDLFDMSGNAFEWCWDWYGDYPTEPQENPRGSEKGEYRVLRGGSWFYVDGFCRVGYRFFYPGFRNSYDGFRLTQGLPSTL